ncbi:hypothetical protein Bbelb_102680 [Branchiostoma belcheri]|nr:hypothetical protein Bbelb_102680 [Branchiostoma belcheri]
MEAMAGSNACFPSNNFARTARIDGEDSILYPGGVTERSGRIPASGSRFSRGGLSPNVRVGGGRLVDVIFAVSVVERDDLIQKRPRKPLEAAWNVSVRIHAVSNG